jgi:DNA polymerase I-like protein with 3'-5' exonuclease and polymerase domains
VYEVIEAAIISIDSGEDVHEVTASALFPYAPLITYEMRQIAKRYNVAVYRKICEFQTQT